MRSPLLREVRGQGLLLGIELTRRAAPYLDALTERGVLALQAGPNVIRLLPPLVISGEQLDFVLDAVEDVLAGEGNGGASRAIVRWSRFRGQFNSRAKPPARPSWPCFTRCLPYRAIRGRNATLAQFLVAQARQMGLDACVDEAGNFVASTSARDVTEQAQPIVLLGHMDTVRGVVPVRLEEGLLYGRGAVDAKGPLAAFLCAVARLASSGDSLRHPLVVIGAVEEEAATSRGARAVVERYRPAACIIGEPSGSAAVTIGYKGRLLVEYRLARAVSHSAGQQQNSSEAAIGFWNRVTHHAGEWNARNAAPAAHSAFASLMPSLRGITSSQDGLEEQTRLTIGYRLPPDFDTAALREQLAQWAKEDQATLNFSSEEATFQSTRATLLARAFVAAIRESGGQPSFKLKTGTSDMNVVGPAWGQNIVAYGPGDSRLDHTPREHVAVVEYGRAIDVLEGVLRTLVIEEVGRPLEGVHRS